MLQELEDSDAVAGRQDNPFMPGDDLLGYRKRRPHHERGEIETLVGGCRGEETLLFARSA